MVNYARSSFNRTIVELKHEKKPWTYADEASFNRTIVELKLIDYSEKQVCQRFLLIEPLWN